MLYLFHPIFTLYKYICPDFPDSKEKRRPSFFNRLNLRGRKRDGSVHSESSQLAAATADPVSSSIDGARILMSPAASGYIPHHKEPVKYQRVKSNNKHTRDFAYLFLAQELTLARDSALSLSSSASASTSAPTTTTTTNKDHVHKSSKPADITSHDGAIWCMEFSQDGRYLAAAGQDGVVRVYAVLSQPEDRFNEEDNTPDPSHGERLRAPVFTSKPVRQFSGHEGEVLDLTWSKNGFLLSSSMDKSVRLWHLDYQENLCVFKHSDFVTSISFHPRDDRFFLAGSLDSTLRLWSIPDKAVAFSASTSDIITAVAFTPDGRTCIAGMLNGLCMFFETEGLKLEKEIHVRSSRGRNSKGSKITGIETLESAAPGDEGVKVLITSNDSRIRLYNLRDKALELKLKGHENMSSQLHSRLSDDGRYVVCGSEDKKVFIWPMVCSDLDPKDKDKRPVEYFEAHDDIVTVAMFAPSSTRRLIGASDDPVYDLCNPPPITLISRDEESASQASFSPGNNSNNRRSLKPGDSPAYIARAGHKDGNILVTSDKRGVIRVWRQDCAFSKRRHENLSSHRLSTLTRTGSIMTRTSFASSAPYSRRTSISQLHSAAVADAAIVDKAEQHNHNMHSDMINSWRHNVEGGSETRSSSVATPAVSEASGRDAASEKSARDYASEKSIRDFASERRGRTRSTSRPHTPPYSDRRDISASHSPVSSVTSRDLQVPPTPSFSYDSIEESPEESDSSKPTRGFTRVDHAALARTATNTSTNGDYSRGNNANGRFESK
ncbi:hypothetical protein TD95_003870 [Thielaviopsis punctulata]|uniref:Uncharacterized protein n=1 Tax=Thielaviopsis punctulata TaxID=72032 RepID=A0A0F4ZJA9_9PEZI|nr:hypothetical protein TD95_003870 [Thielaviopsis punctulata]